MPKLSDRVNTFTDSVIRRMTRISDEYGAINLSQGFPDFDPPKAILDRLAEVAYEGPHQYSVTFGAENFREALAKKQGKAIGREIDPETEIVVTCQNEKSQLKNKEQALKVLYARVYERERRAHDAAISADRRSQVGTGDRSERIRTYNFPQGRVTDHRIGLTLHKIDAIMDGDLNEMMDTLATTDRMAKMQET